MISTIVSIIHGVLAPFIWAIRFGIDLLVWPWRQVFKGFEFVVAMGTAPYIVAISVACGTIVGIGFFLAGHIRTSFTIPPVITAVIWALLMNYNALTAFVAVLIPSAFFIAANNMGYLQSWSIFHPRGWDGRNFFTSFFMFVWAIFAVCSFLVGR